MNQGREFDERRRRRREGRAGEVREPSLRARRLFQRVFSPHRRAVSARLKIPMKLNFASGFSSFADHTALIEAELRERPSDAGGGRRRSKRPGTP